MKIGVSSYSFSKYMKASGCNYLAICDLAKEMGFDGIEFTDLMPEVSGCDAMTAAKQIREHCAEIGLEIAAHTVGANFLLFSIIGTLVIAAIMLVLSFVGNNMGHNYLLVVHYDERYSKEVTGAVNKMVQRYKLKSKTATRNGIEMTLELRLQGNRSNLVDNLLNVPGVQDATLVAFQNEIA